MPTTKPWYARWWVWFVGAVVVVGAAGSIVSPGDSGADASLPTRGATTEPTATTTSAPAACEVGYNTDAFEILKIVRPSLKSIDVYVADTTRDAVKAVLSEVADCGGTVSNSTINLYSQRGDHHANSPDLVATWTYNVVWVGCGTSDDPGCNAPYIKWADDPDGTTEVWQP